MKKIFATFLTLILVLGFSCPAYAGVTIKSDDQNYVTASFDYSNDEKSFRTLEQSLKEEAEQANLPAPIWILASTNSHQGSKYYFSSNKESENLEKYYNWFSNSSDVDFIQVGTLMESRLRESVEASFENDPKKAAEDLLTSMTAPSEQLSELDDRIPVYWNIEDTGTNSEEFIIEVAVGKYEIKPGDCLSVIAERYDTTLGQLLSDNQNITNPDLIYAGDYLVVK